MKKGTKDMSTEIAKQTTDTGLQNYKEELKRQALAAAGQEANAGGGQFFSVKGGRLAFGGNPIPGSAMEVIILDGVCENVLYEGEYDPNNPASPVCFAFGRDEATMAPHENVVAPKSKLCSTCPLNEWASADKGRGKACKNRRRLACISVPKSAAAVAEETVGYLALPPTSINGWAQYVKSVAGSLELPPRAVVTKVSVVPDAKTQLKINFGLIGPVSDDLLGAVLQRGKEVESQIAFPYTAVKELDKKPVAPAAKKARKY